MEILRTEAALLSNFEVLQLLNDQKAQRHLNETHGGRDAAAENLRTIEFEIQKYLNNSSCSSQDPEQIKTLKDAFASYDLMKVEILQILNLRPRTPVELVLIIEEFEERFTVEDCEKMLDLITKALPRDDDEPMEDADGEAVEQ